MKKIDEARARMLEEQKNPSRETIKFRERMDEIMNKASNMKKHMLERNLRKAKAKCPYCDGFWFGTIGGSRNHLHLQCSGTCRVVFME